MMKKFLAFLLLLSMTYLFCGCSNIHLRGTAPHYEENTYSASDEIESVTIDEKNTPIQIVSSDSKTVSVTYYRADDGSEDYYGNRLDELVQLDSRISVFHKKNEGVSVARNFGVNKATGQYILFVDGDDILTPWLLESAVQAVEDYDCDVIVGRINTTDKRPSIFPSREKNVKFELLDDHKKKELECHIFSKSCERWRPDQDGWEFNGEGCWAHFLKKEIALENQFIPGVAVGEDTIWALTMLNSSKDYRIGMLYEKWYYYIQNDYSVLHKYNPKIV